VVGFSLGGNLVLKYLGERADAVPTVIRAAVAVSVPVDLLGCADALERPGNFIYRWRFLRTLRQKVEIKATQFPGQIDTTAFEDIRSLRDFDEHYTAPLHGFSSAEDYYRRCSSRPLLPNITVPTLLINAANDPFLAPTCFPHNAALCNPHFSLLVPTYGGHVGFVETDARGTYWSEAQAGAFVDDVTQSTMHVSIPAGIPSRS